MESFAITGTTGTIGSTWTVMRYSIPGENGAPPMIMSIIATPWVRALTMVDAAKNSEWIKYMAIDRPVIAEIVMTGTQQECVIYASKLAGQTQPHCNRYGFVLTAKTSRLLCSNGQTYENQTDASQALGLAQSAISKHLRGELVAVKGLTFSRVR